MNSAYQSMQNSQLSPLFLQYAKGGNSGNDQTIDKQSILYNMMPDPMATILRLKKVQPTKADELLKRMVARQVVTDDPYLPDLLLDGKSDELKEYLFAKQLKTADPFMQTILYKKFGNSADHAAFAAGDQKELIQTKLIADRFGDKIDQIAPNDAYLMFKFLETTTKANPNNAGGKEFVPSAVILEVALGNDVAGIKATDFQEKFGVAANDFVCAAHEDTIRVPCMVNQEVVLPGECQAMGCCYNELFTSTTAKARVPKCYHNLIGKIGSGIAQHLIKDDTVKALFGGTLPELQDLQAASNWAESQMPDVLRRLNKAEGSYFGNPRGQESWWGNNYNSGSSNFNIFATPAPSTRKFEWKAHGPTAMPNAGDLEIPEIGGFVTSEGNDVEQLDFIINRHMDSVRGQLNSESYTCQLIQPEHMVNCYDNNYEALKVGDPQASCQSKGCCYRELNLFDNNPVCYRSLRSGHCDLPVSQRGNTIPGTAQAAADAYWTANPYRQQCGAQGISRGECLLNPLCCFDTNPRQEGEPFCYRRGGAEQLFDQQTGNMANQCELTDITQREECFDGTSKFGKLLNRMATEDQCIQAGCCFSQAAADAASSMGVLGSMNLAGPHCFKRPGLQDNDLSVANNYDMLDKVQTSDLLKVCANDPQWPSLAQRKWQQDPTTGR